MYTNNVELFLTLFSIKIKCNIELCEIVPSLYKFGRVRVKLSAKYK